MSVRTSVHYHSLRIVENRPKPPKNNAVAYSNIMDASICPPGLVFLWNIRRNFRETCFKEGRRSNEESRRSKREREREKMRERKREREKERERENERERERDRQKDRQRDRERDK